MNQILNKPKFHIFVAKKHKFDFVPFSCETDLDLAINKAKEQISNGTAKFACVRSYAGEDPVHAYIRGTEVFYG